jgi:hypothetical protein
VGGPSHNCCAVVAVDAVVVVVVVVGVLVVVGIVIGIVVVVVVVVGVVVVVVVAVVVVVFAVVVVVVGKSVHRWKDLPCMGSLAIQWKTSHMGEVFTNM